MTFWQALILGIVEGITEFLPVSSTGHLTIAEKLLGLSVDDPGVTAFTAVIQVGAIIASIIYFRADILRLAGAWFRGLANAEARRENDYRMAWLVIIGSIPIGVVGLLARHLITGPFRSLWVVVGGLVVWSFVMVLAERVGAPGPRRGDPEPDRRHRRRPGPVPRLRAGVSRSGATISAGLFQGLDRVSATRLSFFLAIPALTAAGIFEAATSAGDISSSVGWGPTIVATGVSLVVALATIAWLLRLVARFPITVFVGYRLLLAGVVAVLLLTGAVPPADPPGGRPRTAAPGTGRPVPPRWGRRLGVRSRACARSPYEDGGAERLLGPSCPWCCATARPGSRYVGDPILDGWWRGRTERMSREAPAPVVEVFERRHVPGGAANTAVNLAALGAQVEPRRRRRRRRRGPDAARPAGRGRGQRDRAGARARGPDHDQGAHRGR